MEVVVMGFAFLSLAVALFTLLRVTSLQREVESLSRIASKVDALEKSYGSSRNQSPMASDSNREILESPKRNPKLEQEIEAALIRGEIIQAVKFYRDATGVGLKEAKDYVDQVRQRLGQL